MPGVLLVLHHGNIGPLYRTVPGDDNATNSEVRSAFEDEVVRHWGQYIAVVIAETLEQATAAAAAVRWNTSRARKSSHQPRRLHRRAQISSKRGEPERAFASAPVKVDQTYITPIETHNPIEMHASVAVWDGDRVTLYETSQGVVNHRVVMAQVLGLPVENVRVVTRFLGSGFGGKLFPWPHSAMTAVAARRLGRPVKLSLNRRMMFSMVGYRPRTEQRIRLGATKEGKLLALRHDYLNVTSLLDDFDEGCGEATPYLLQRRQSRSDERNGTPQRRRADVDARSRRGAGALRARVGHERAGRRTEDGSAAAADAERRRKRREQQHALLFAAFPRVF